MIFLTVHISSSMETKHGAQWQHKHLKASSIPWPNSAGFCDFNGSASQILQASGGCFRWVVSQRPEFTWPMSRIDFVNFVPTQRWRDSFLLSCADAHRPDLVVVEERWKNFPRSEGKHYWQMHSKKTIDKIESEWIRCVVDSSFSKVSADIGTGTCHGAMAKIDDLGGSPPGAITGGVAPTARSREGCGGGLPGGQRNRMDVWETDRNSFWNRHRLTQISYIRDIRKLCECTLILPPTFVVCASFPSCMILYAPHCSHESSSLYINTFNIVHYFITQRPVCTLVGNFYLMRLKQTTVAACSGNSSHLKYLEVISKCARAACLWILCFLRSTSCNHSIHCGKDPFECWEGSCSRTRHSTTRGRTPPFGWHLAFWLGEHSLVLLIGILVGIRWWDMVGWPFTFGIPLPQDVKSISPI